ncbi:MAG TPA: DUF5672 family protein, partial [Chitinophagaceae bacterium]|nr:DUF5672 family protein [Chitinophagaceae bacterium]
LLILLLKSRHLTEWITKLIFMHGSEKNVVVVIPLYSFELSETEKKTLKHNLTILKKHPVVFLKPENLQLSLPELLPGFEIDQPVGFISFANKYFISPQHYNKLLLKKEFYEKFSEYKYILICQQDVFIFSDELNFWINKKYDYIGAPWPFEDEKKILQAARKSKISWWYFVTYKLNYWFFNKKNYAIGNGGLSLRNVKKSLFIVKLFSGVIKKYELNEDIFWSINAPLLNPFFRVPNLKDALSFSFEKEPAYYYKMNDEKLPFGCHAWEKYEPDFWKKHIRT